jgi:hypothetical protein
MADTNALATMPMLERRRIEAQILKHVYEVVKASHGEAAAKKTLADAVRRSALEQGAQYAAKAGGQTSMRTFIDSQAQWRMSDALTVDEKETTDRTHVFNVTRCKYAEMYKEMGLGDIGHLLSCQRDGTFCEGYDPRLKLERTQTIMQGASHCDFKFTWVADESGKR